MKRFSVTSLFDANWSSACWELSRGFFLLSHLLLCRPSPFHFYLRSKTVLAEKGYMTFYSSLPSSADVLTNLLRKRWNNGINVWKSLSVTKSPEEVLFIKKGSELIDISNLLENGMNAMVTPYEIHSFKLTYSLFKKVDEMI